MFGCINQATSLSLLLVVIVSSFSKFILDVTTIYVLIFGIGSGCSAVGEDDKCAWWSKVSYQGLLYYNPISAQLCIELFDHICVFDLQMWCTT